MANDERQSETFIREVDEELRRDQLKALWNRFAPYIIGVCVLIVVITAGYRGWMWWQAKQAAEAGDRFMAALSEIETGDKAKGEAELAAIAAQAGTGYSALAKLRLAGEKAAADKSAALAAYDAVANDAAVPQPLRDLGRMRAALLALDTGDLAGAKERAQPLNIAGNPWRHAAREVIGTADYQAGNLQAARDVFTEIQQDAETPQDLWIRSGLMVSLIDSQLAVPSAGPAGDASNEPGANAAGEAVKPEASVPAVGKAPGSSSTASPADLPVPSEGATGLPATGMEGDAADPVAATPETIDAAPDGVSGSAPAAPAPAPGNAPAPIPAPVPSPVPAPAPSP
jgi:hypothetical protein